MKARRTILEADVLEACDQLSREGQKPTQSALRRITGVGYKTSERYLKKWEKLQNQKNSSISLESPKKSVNLKDDQEIILNEAYIANKKLKEIYKQRADTLENELHNAKENISALDRLLELIDMQQPTK